MNLKDVLGSYCYSFNVFFIGWKTFPIMGFFEFVYFQVFCDPVGIYCGHSFLVTFLGPLEINSLKGLMSQVGQSLTRNT